MPPPSTEGSKPRRRLGDTFSGPTPVPPSSTKAHRSPGQAQATRARLELQVYCSVTLLKPQWNSLPSCRVTQFFRHTKPAVLQMSASRQCCTRLPPLSSPDTQWLACSLRQLVRRPPRSRRLLRSGNSLSRPGICRRCWARTQAQLSSCLWERWTWQACLEPAQAPTYA